MLATVAAVALGLQGCATTGGSDVATPSAASSWHATGPNSSIESRPSANQPVVKADNKENFEAVVAAIHKQMSPGGRWEYINASERVTIDGSFGDMRQLYDRYGSVDKMDQAAKLRLFADQNTVNTILTKKDGERVICKSVVPVGSHLPVQSCQTYAQMQAEHNRSQEILRRNAPTTQNSNVMGGGH